MSTSPSLQIERIALYLGHPWKVNRLRDPSNWSMEIIDGQGHGLHFRVDGQHFKVSGLFPRERTTPHGTDYHIIGLSINRPAKDLAADIMRRLIPHYLQSYEAAASRYTAEKAQQERLTLIAQSFMRVSEGRIADHSRAARTVYFENGKAELWSSEDITLELHKLTIEQAIKIVALLKA